jgi:CRP-like cAMP-binding protein
MPAHAIASPIVCGECPVRRLALFQPLSREELVAMQSHRLEQRTLPAGAVLYAQDSRIDETYTLFQGWAMLHRTLDDGRRQILKFALPGDFLGFQPALDAPVLHSAQALTPVTLCVFKREALMQMFREHPTLAIRMAWITAREEASAHDHLTSLGRRPAKERLAHLFLELHQRLSARGAVDERAGIPVPLKQEHLADALGLTTIHVNRTLRVLREAGLAVLRGGVLRIANRAALVELTGYRGDPFAPRPML